MPSSPKALNRFDPRIRTWFEERMGRPTDAQIRSWPKIANGEHLLLTAPTGSGKTLAAFLWVMNQLITGAWPLDATHVLYISPLKALNSDIQRNLIAPLAELEGRFRDLGDAWPAIRVLTRSGDTPQNERRRQVLRPPEIFITTPETLNLMLASAAGPAVFSQLKAVILDEIHAVAGSKRGTHLMTAVEWLTELSGEFQRIALSATVEPTETIARWVGGRRRIAPNAFEPRSVAVVRAKMTKAYEVTVCAPEMTGLADGQPIGGEFWWDALTNRLRQVIAANRSTIIFVNNRRLSERIAAQLNDGEPRPIAYSHHGSLSHETRRTIEQRLKDGELPAIVATASLELGIDIGALDQVVLLGTPPSVSSALQRIGRAGHGVGQVSRAMIFPTFPRDFVDAAVIAGAVERRDIEPLSTVRAPLDLLAQWIVSMTGRESRTVDDLYDAIRESEAYRDLPRARLEDVLQMLSGQADGERMRAYGPLISWDRIEGAVSATKGAMRSVYISGGTIADRGYYAMRHEGSGAKIGELDEEFVWEQWPGATFTFGAQAWTIQKITENDVLVKPGNTNDAGMPFWKAEDRSRDTHFSGLIGNWLEEADEHLRKSGRPDEQADNGSVEAWIRESGRLEDEAAAYLTRILRAQRRTTGAPLPHRHHILAEYTPIHGADQGTVQLILHLPWGGRVNRPLALVLAALWEEREGVRPQAFAGNDGLAMHLPWSRSASVMLKETPAHRIEDLLRKTLEGSGLFGAHFREAAARALLLPRSDPKRRMPLWLSRVKAKKLYQAVARHPGFPLLVEAWRSCLQDEFDLHRLREMLEEIRDGRIEVSEVEMAKPSPFAEGIVWRETNALMYRGDSTPAGVSSVRPDLIEEVAATPALRPKLAMDAIEVFGRKLRRVYPEYAPRPGRDLVDWVKQRSWIPEAEWAELLDAVQRDHPEEKFDGKDFASKLLWIQRPGGTARGIAALDSVGTFIKALGETGETFVAAPMVEASPHTPPKTYTAMDSILKKFDKPKTKTRARDGAPGDEPDANADANDRSERALWLGNWLSFYGPVERDWIRQTLSFDRGDIDAALDELTDARALVEGNLSEHATATEVCDAENYEHLLRIGRRQARPSFEALPADQLQLFLAWRQGLTQRGNGPEGLQERLEPLLGLPLSAARVERDFLPSRVSDYSTAWLDVTFQESDLMWFGIEKENIVFCFRDQLDIVRQDSEASLSEESFGHSAKTHESPDKFPELEPGRSYAYDELLAKSGSISSNFASRLWEAVWSGRIGGDTATGLRRGVLSGFKAPKDSRSHRGPRRGISKRNRWQTAEPFPGPWRAIPPAETAEDAIDDLERQKERVRLLLDRYGVVFRELLAHETPTFRWGALFRVLRLMELGGEIMAGHFFHGVPGLQFIAPEALESLRRGLPGDPVYWMNAIDPASICGAKIEGLSWKPPARRATTHVIMMGAKPALVSQRMGRVLRFHLSPDAPRMDEVMDFFRIQLTRAFDPVSVLTIEKINGRPAPESPFLPIFRERFDCSVEPERILIGRAYYP